MSGAGCRVAGLAENITNSVKPELELGLSLAIIIQPRSMMQVEVLKEFGLNREPLRFTQTKSVTDPLQRENHTSCEILWFYILR